jgi:hypothetical protein
MTRARPERPDFLDEPSDRVRARHAQIDRLSLKLERTYRMWLSCRNPELREAFEATIAEYQDRIAHLQRLNKAAGEK